MDYHYKYATSLTDLSLRPLPEPWSVEIPDGFPETAEKIDAYAVRHGWYYITATMPTSGDRRVNKTTEEIEQRAFIIEWDDVTDEHFEKLKTRIDALEHSPNWFIFTPNGFRLVFEFEAPIRFTSRDHYKEFQIRLTQFLKLNRSASGFDKNALYSPQQIYRLGEWHPVGEDRLKLEVLMGLFMDTVKTAAREPNAMKEEYWGKLVDKLKAKHPDPGFDWGDFAPGFRCTRFWGGGDSLSCIVHLDGIHAFSGEGRTKHWREEDLLGEAAYLEIVGGNVVGYTNKYWCIGRKWLERQDHGGVEDIDLGMLKTVLKTKFGLSPLGKGGVSEIDEALTLLREKNLVCGICAAHYVNKDVIETPSGRFLNVSRAKAFGINTHNLQKRIWGDGFPRIAKLVDSIMTPDTKERWLSWIHFVYKNALHNKPVRSLALATIGDPGIGKTFLIKFVVVPLLGGISSDAADWLIEGDDFNDEIIKAPVLLIEDPKLPSHGRGGVGSDRFSKRVKRLIANREVNVRAMGVSGRTSQFYGHIIMSCNNTPSALRAMPLMDTTIKDKLLVLEMKSSSPPFPNGFPTPEELQSNELSAFAEYLYGLEIPPHLANPRFGIHGYIPPALEADIAYNQSGGDCMQAFYTFLSTGELYKTSKTKKEYEIQGTLMEIYKQIIESEDSDLLTSSFKSAKDLYHFFQNMLSVGKMHLGTSVLEATKIDTHTIKITLKPAE